MRTYEEIDAEIRAAASIKDAEAVRVLAAEMQGLSTPEAQATALNALGIVALIIGEYPSALEHFRQSLALQEELGNRTGVASVTGNIGIVFRETGDFASALEHYRRVLAVHEELDSRAGVARAISNIGLVYCDTGDYPAALEHYRRALALYEDLGDRACVADIIGNMGILYWDSGDFSAAIDHFQRALAMHEELGYRAGVADVTSSIGMWHARMGDYSAALDHYRRTLAIHEERNNSAGVSRTTGSIIRALIDLYRFDEAEELLKRQTSMPMDNPVVRAAHKENYATLAEIREDLDVAQELLIEALAITTEAGLRHNSTLYHMRLRDLAQKRNDFAGYIEHNAEYQRITEEIRGNATTQRMAMMEAERRVQEERLKNERERALLYGALPQSVADRMIRGETVTGDHFDSAAVMFLDIAGFTSNTSSMAAADVVKMLEHIFGTIDGICTAHDVVKVKTIGDSYMCFRGDADTIANARSIASVALDVMKGAQTWPAGEPLQYRIGLHIGPATAGVIGTQRLQYDVWGDTVNVASRMESSGEPGRIHVSEAFATALRSVDSGQWTVDSHNDSLTPDSLTLLERGEISIKGKGPMTTYWLEAR